MELKYTSGTPEVNRILVPEEIKTCRATLLSCHGGQNEFEAIGMLKIIILLKNDLKKLKLHKKNIKNNCS